MKYLKNDQLYRNIAPVRIRTHNILPGKTNTLHHLTKEFIQLLTENDTKKPIYGLPQPNLKKNLVFQKLQHYILHNNNFKSISNVSLFKQINLKTQINELKGHPENCYMEHIINTTPHILHL